MSLAHAYADIGEVESAKESYMDSIRYNSSLVHPKALALVESWYNLGLLQYDSGEIDKAVESYTLALEIRVKRTLTRDILNNLGNAYAKGGRIDEAIMSYERALALDPNDKYVRHNLEVVRKWKKR
jgi:tetratricopeptide (TPR) repeat protein